MLTLGTGTEFLLPQCQDFMVWASQLFLYKRRRDNIISFLPTHCLLCSIKAQTLWSKLCFPDFQWCPEQRGPWWPTAVRIIGIVTVINQTSGWAGFCPLPTYSMDMQGKMGQKTMWEAQGWDRCPPPYLPNSKTKLQLKIRWRGKTISFLQSWDTLLNFLSEAHFYGQVVKIWKIVFVMERPTPCKICRSSEIAQR